MPDADVPGKAPCSHTAPSHRAAVPGAPAQSTRWRGFRSRPEVSAVSCAASGGTSNDPDLHLMQPAIGRQIGQRQHAAGNFGGIGVKRTRDLNSVFRKTAEAQKRHAQSACTDQHRLASGMDAEPAFDRRGKHRAFVTDPRFARSADSGQIFPGPAPLPEKAPWQSQRRKYSAYRPATTADTSDTPAVVPWLPLKDSPVPSALPLSPSLLSLVGTSIPQIGDFGNCQFYISVLRVSIYLVSIGCYGGFSRILFLTASGKSAIPCHSSVQDRQRRRNTHRRTDGGFYFTGFVPAVGLSHFFRKL